MTGCGKIALLYRGRTTSQQDFLKGTELTHATLGAQALLKKEVGDEEIVKTATGQFVWRLTKIEYQK